MISNRPLLLETARRGELHHAIILHGPSQELLRATAFDLARALNCSNGSGGDGCVSCQKIERGIHPDVHHIAVADDRKLIAVEQIREMVSAATLRPFEGRTKVFIVDPADAISTSGANALLKTLEEPSRDTVFLLLTRTPDLLLPTVRSRSQSIPLRAEETAAKPRAGETVGVARLAEQFPSVDRADIRSLYETATEALREYAATRNAGALLRLAAQFAEVEPAAVSLAIFGSFVRDVAASGDDRFSEIRDGIGTAALLNSAERALRGGLRLGVNTDVRLLLEQCVIELTKK